MADLVSGRYGQLSPLASLVGKLSNVTQSNIPARSNLEFPVGNLTDGALAASGICTAVPVPMDAGTTISFVTILVGATAASTPTHGFGALYSGIATPALLGQSTDLLTGVIAASAPFQYKLTVPYLVKDADVVNGYLYVSVNGTGTAVQTVMSMATPTAIGYQWFGAATTPIGASPIGMAVTHGSAVGGTAPATIASPSAKAVAPIVFLT